MAWHAQLDLHYRLAESGCAQTLARYQHSGPLRILQSLYPEGPGICHNVLVHPPSGLVGGDTLQLNVQVDPGAHGLITTPGATRFYRSTDEEAMQSTRLTLADNARLEWLPLEAIAYNACRARNEVRVDLAPSAQLIGWDVTALGLPHANQPFASGTFWQHLELTGAWLERGGLSANTPLDRRWLESPLGLHGMRCVGSLFWLRGAGLQKHTGVEQALESARTLSAQHPLAPLCGVTCPNDQVVVLRVLGLQVEPVMQILKAVWLQWRQNLWNVGRQTHDTAPRIWAM
jgi:urease accessory protein